MTDERIEFEYIPIDELAHYPRNPKDHDIGQLTHSIRGLGYATPIVYDTKQGYIAAGHGRIDALLEMYNQNPNNPPKRILKDADGRWLVPVNKLAFDSEAELQAFIIADNRLTEIGGWDEVAQAELLTEIASNNLLDLTGYDGDDLDAMLAMVAPSEAIFDSTPQVDKAKELQAQWQTERGQVWLIGGKHRVMCGDSTSGEDVARLMGGKRADCVVTDPPYGMKLDTNYKRGNTGVYNGVSDANRNNYPSVIGDDSDFDPMPIMKLFDCAHQFWFGADYYAERIPNKNDGAWLVWDKKTGIENLEFSLSEFELIWSKKRVARQFIRVKWFGIQGMEKQDTKNRVHPTQKPLDVIKWIIEKYCDGVIVDPFLGSGTTLIACAQTGRVCYGMEISPEYVAVVLQRAVDAGLECELLL